MARWYATMATSVIPLTAILVTSGGGSWENPKMEELIEVKQGGEGRVGNNREHGH